MRGGEARLMIGTDYVRLCSSAGVGETGAGQNENVQPDCHRWTGSRPF